MHSKCDSYKDNFTFIIFKGKGTPVHKYQILKACGGFESNTPRFLRNKSHESAPTASHWAVML